MRFQATQWKDGSWMVVYLVAECRGLQKTITGETIDVGSGSQMWSGIRGLSGMTHHEASATADVLCDPDWQWDGNSMYDAEGCVLGEVIENQPRQPGDDYWVPRTIMAWAMVGGRRVVEWYADGASKDARAWVMATAARDIASSLIIDG